MAKAKYKQREDGRWYTTYWDGTYTPDGKKKRVSVYSTKSSADLEKKVNALKRQAAEKASGEEPDEEKDMDIYLYAKQWLSTYKSSKTTNTKKMYENVIEKYIRKLYGLSIRKIRHSHFQFLLSEASQYPRLCQQVKLCFKQIMKSAARDRYYRKSDLDDLFDGLETPTYRPAERRALTSEEKTAIQEAPFTDRERTFVYIAFGCGLRRGEILALTPFDIDLKRGVIKVTKSIEFDVNTPAEKDTKNYKHREVPMPPFLLSWMKNHRFSNGQRIISKLDGSTMTKSSYDKMWRQIKQKIFDTKKKETFETISDYDLTAHYFRHNYCASLCYQVPTVSIKKIAALLGDSEKMVLEVYNHIVEDNEKVEEALKSAINF